MDVENPYLVVTKSTNGILTIRLNNPKKLNAISGETYKAITKILREAEREDSVKIVVLTGTGHYFSSGNDLTNFTNFDPNVSKEEQAFAGGEMFSAFVKSFIDFPKILVGLVNGPAVGIMVTVLGLFDLVYAVDNAHFKTPFAKLGQAPEGCSTFTFPRLMGRQKALEMFCLERQLSAQEAESCGLVTRVFPKEKFEHETSLLLDKLAAMPFKSVLACKSLIGHHTQDTLRAVNQRESAVLIERWASEDCMEAVLKFLTSKL